jgi:hypothetical protein
MEDRKRSDIYRIRVKGHLDSSWSEWFEGLTIANEVNGTTALTGTVADQAALHGLIAKVRDLGLPLLLVERVEIETSARGSSSAAQEEYCADEPSSDWRRKDHAEPTCYSTTRHRVDGGGGWMPASDRGQNRRSGGHTPGRRR